MPGMKVFPDKTCKCGATFNRRIMPNGRLQDAKLFLAQRHCSRTCGNTRKVLKPGSYLWRARKFRKDACEACGYTKRLAVHHCDQDQTNNNPANLQTLCSHCHDYWHATAKRLGKAVAGRMPCFVSPTALLLGWTDLKPLAMDRFQSWQQQHSEFCQGRSEAV